MTLLSAPPRGDHPTGSATRPRARTPTWIVCHGAARPVVDGGVFCQREDIVAWQSCVNCHFLEALDEDRQRGCGEVESFDSPATPQLTNDRHRWPELIIELL